MTFRTDENMNPCAVITELAKQAGLKLGVDYEAGTKFPGESSFVTAKFLGDPIAISIRLIDAIGYYTKAGTPRWTYIAMPNFVWEGLSQAEKRDVVGYHYLHEGGVKLRPLFPNYGRP